MEFWSPTTNLKQVRVYHKWQDGMDRKYGSFQVYFSHNELQQEWVNNKTGAREWRVIPTEERVEWPGGIEPGKCRGKVGGD